MKLLLFTKRNKNYDPFIERCKQLFSNVKIIFPDFHLKRRHKDYKDFVKTIKDYNPDLILSFYYNRIIQKEIINASNIASLNFHGSLLPNYAGSHTINWQIINGEIKSGVTLHELTSKVDAGRIALKKEFLIDLEDEAIDILRKGVDSSCHMLLEVFEKISKKELIFENQKFDGSEFTCLKRVPEDGQIKPGMTHLQVYNLVRALTKPWPGAFYYKKNNEKVIVNYKISMEEAKAIIKDI